ncbi:unnamed protein product [Rhodiola kirilowii]
MGSKQIETDSSLPEPDRISDLPSDINSFILDRLSIREAVATSILSKDWRHKWRRIGNLIFDEEFLADVISPIMEGDYERMDLEYNNIVRRILLLHLGPVRKVVLFIPYFAHTLPCEFLSSWMPFISRTEVKELIIENHHSLKFRLPSDIFHCNELQHLKLDVHTLDRLPQDFGEFCNLISLDLRVSEDEGVIGNLISKCPLLERLSLDCTACTQPLVIDAPRLRFLNVCIGRDPDVIHLLQIVHFGMSPDFCGDIMSFCNLISIFGSVPKVETVILSLPPTLAVTDMPPDALMSLPTTLYNHKSLTLLRVDISSPECIYFVLCVLKSSPNLQMLNLGVIDILPSETSEDEAALHFLDLQTRKIEALKSLLTVKIKGLLESKTGVMFIKMILSCSPVLKTMYLTGNDSTFLYSRSGEEFRNEAEFTLMPELLQCPRASSRAQITEMGSSQLNITDRISDLPSNIINCIFDRISIRDAVATSILCKEWRHKWRRIPNLVFDEKFVDDVICRRTQGEPAMLKHEYSNIISKILLLHLGPIRKFVLHIPSFCNGKTPLDLSSWMLFISQNEVKELIIEDKHTPKFLLPLYVFQCNELQHLKLDARELKLHLPQDFRGFFNLLSLDWSGLHDKGEICNLVSKCPLLEKLSLHLLDCRLPWVIEASRLRFPYCCFPFDAYLTLNNTGRVTAISLRGGNGRPVQLNLPVPPSNISVVFPKAEIDYLRSLQKVVDVPRDPLAYIHTTLHNLKNLTLMDIDISSQASIYFIIYIICSSPNLRMLNLGFYPSATNVDDATLHSLDELIKEPVPLNSLLTVKIKGLLGSKVEILLIKVILSWSTVLKTLHFTGAKNLQNQAELTMISELLQCPRPSCRAQVIYSKYPGDSSIFDF